MDIHGPFRNFSSTLMSYLCMLKHVKHVKAEVLS